MMAIGHKRINESCISSSDILSDGLGLDMVTRACRAVGGTASLVTFTDAQQRTHTQLRLVIPAALIPAARTRSHQPEGTALETEESVDATAAPKPPSIDASAKGGAVASPLCLALDDDLFMRSYLAAVLEVLGAHPSSAVLGETGTSSIEKLLARATSSSVDISGGEEGLAETAPPVSLILLDENLQFGPDETYSGSGIAAQLRGRGFRGRICICSGESLKTSSKLQSNEHVDLVLIKGSLTFNEVCNRLRDLLADEPTRRRDL